jgi:protocatechuate 3,4-dioxygenase beta subunit
VALLFLSQLTFAQDKEAPTPRRKGSITGRVVAADGQPMMNARVFVVPVGVTNAATRTFTTDEEGNFTADGLLVGVYSISADAPAYITETSRDPDRQIYYRLGETATITMRKGGVLTGRVTNQKGEPLQGLEINAMRVRDEAGRKIASGFQRSDSTDDRGIYRLYGLQPGAYLISASGGEPGFLWGGPGSPFDEHVPIFYPSSTRDTATEIKVQAGEEVQGIDIRYRGEKGHRISGSVTGLPLKSKSGELAYAGANLLLGRVPGGSVERYGSTYELQEQKAFVLHGVPDGEYELKATASDWRNEDAEVYTSPKRRVTVKGTDVTGIILAMRPLATIAGQLALEPAPEKEACSPRQEPSFEETLLTLRRYEARNEARDEALADMGEFESEDGYQRAASNEKGEFKFRRLEAGRYHVLPRLLNETWYIKSITLKSNTPSPKSQISNRTSQIINVKPGDKLTGVTITLAEGAASLQGRVTAAPDKPLPPRLRVHLVPAEKDAADNLLRYQEFTTKADGAFTFPNLAPGSYWLLARAVPEDESDEKPAKPAAWDADARLKLRREAEAANNAISLTPCQRVPDYTFAFSNTVGK